LPGWRNAYANADGYTDGFGYANSDGNAIGYAHLLTGRQSGAVDAGRSSGG